MRVLFKKNPMGAFRLGYFAGESVELDDKLAAEIIEAGFGCEYSVEPELLPVDFPFKADLEKAGCLTIADVLSYEDLTELSGIGETKAIKIKEYLTGNTDLK